MYNFTKKKLIILLCILVFFTQFILFADDKSFTLLQMPSSSPVIEGYFTEAMDSFHSSEIKNTYIKTWSFFSDFNIYFQETLQINIYAGFKIPITKNISIPLFGGFIFNESGYFGGTSAKNSDHHLSSYSGIGIGGIMITGNYGLLAGYAGYSGIDEKLNEWDSENKRNGELIYKKSYGKFQWAVFPIFTAEKFPLFGSFINIINGFIRMDELSMNRDSFTPSYKANVIFKNIPIGENNKLTLNSYAISNWYNINTKYNLYAGSLGLTIKSWQFILDGGYRDYFDTELNHDRYINGVYSKIAIKYYLDKNTDIYTALYFESGSKPFFENPNIGIMIVNFEWFKYLFITTSVNKGKFDRWSIGFTISIY